MILFFLFLLVIFVMHQEIKPKSPRPKITMLRSVPLDDSYDRYVCGNCHGTGLEDFGLTSNSFECDACEGRGFHEIDPNAKYMTLSEVLESFKNKKE